MFFLAIFAPWIKTSINRFSGVTGKKIENRTTEFTHTPKPANFHRFTMIHLGCGGLSWKQKHLLTLWRHSKSSNPFCGPSKILTAAAQRWQSLKLKLYLTVPMKSMLSLVLFKVLPWRLLLDSKKKPHPILSWWIRQKNYLKIFLLKWFERFSNFLSF